MVVVVSSSGGNFIFADFETLRCQFCTKTARNVRFVLFRKNSSGFNMKFVFCPQQEFWIRISKVYFGRTLLKPLSSINKIHRSTFKSSSKTKCILRCGRVGLANVLQMFCLYKIIEIYKLIPSR